MIFCIPAMHACPLTYVRSYSWSARTRGHIPAVRVREFEALVWALLPSNPCSVRMRVTIHAVRVYAYFVSRQLCGQTPELY